MQYHVTDKPTAGDGEHPPQPLCSHFLFWILCNGSAAYLCNASNASCMTRRWASILRWALQIWCFFWESWKMFNFVKTLPSLFNQPSNPNGGEAGQIPQRPTVTSYMYKCWTTTMEEKLIHVLSPYELQPSLHPERVLYLVQTFLLLQIFRIIATRRNQRSSV